MNIRGRTMAGLAMALAMIPWTGVRAADVAQRPPKSATPVVVSTAAGRTGLRLTVYSSGLALVRERRRVVLPAGDVILRYEDIPASIQPDSVRLQILSAPSAVRIGEQSFHPPTLFPWALLHAYVGKQVLLIRHVPTAHGTRRVTVPATLVSDTGGYIWRIHGHLSVPTPSSWSPPYEVPALPADLYAGPTLVWRLDGGRGGPATLEVQYLAQKLSWHADYALTLAAGGKSAELSAGMTVINDTGQAFRDARLRLVAGQVATVRQPPAPQPELALPISGAVRAAPVAAPAPPVAAQPVFAYHLYTIRPPVTLAAPGNDAISWLRPTEIAVRKAYIVRGSADYLGPMQFSGRTGQEPVEVRLAFANTAADGLGRALPAGTVRIYAPVGAANGPAPGGPIFLGAVRIAGTPVGATVRLAAGRAFDLRARRVETSFRTVKPQVHEATYRITLRNSTPRPVQVQDDEQFRGDWTIPRASQSFTRPNAATARFLVAVPAHATASFTYTVQETY